MQCTVHAWRAHRPTSPSLAPPLLQVACLAAYATAVVLWVWSEYLNYRHKHAKCAGAGVAAAAAATPPTGGPARWLLCEPLHPRCTPRCRRVCACRKSQTHARADSSGGDAEGKPLLPLGGPNGALLDVEATTGGAAPTTPAPGADLNGKPSYAWTTSAFYRCLMLEEEALLACREPLRAAVEFGTIIAWFYVADRTGIIAPGTKVHAWGDGRCCV